MSNIEHTSRAVIRQLAEIVWRLRQRARLEIELTDSSDRALAELYLSRGDVGDIVSGTYRAA